MKDPLNCLKLLFAESANSRCNNLIDIFAKNRTVILQILRDILNKLERHPNYNETFIGQQNGIRYLIQLVLLICDPENVHQNSQEITSCRIIILDILSNICTSSEKVHQILRTLNECTKDGRLMFLVRMLYSELKACFTAALNLTNKILTNTSIIERIAIQCELEHIGFCLFNLEARIRRFQLNDCDLEKLQEFKRLYIYIPQTSSGEFIKSQARQLNEQVEQLRVAFAHIEMEKKILLETERELKDKCDFFVKKFIQTEMADLDVNEHEFEFASDLLCETGSTKALVMQDSDADSRVSLDNFNMKSSEEEIVCAPVINLAAIRNQSHLEPTKHLLAVSKRDICKDALPHLDESFTAHRTQINLSANYVDNFKTSKYFAYIMAKGDNKEISCSGEATFRKSLCKMFRTNRKITQVGDSLISTQCCVPICKPERNEDEQSRFEELFQHKPASFNCNDSLQSLSLPNAFKSNFILRKK